MKNHTMNSPLREKYNLITKLLGKFRQIFAFGFIKVIENGKWLDRLGSDEWEADKPLECLLIYFNL
jgi:hypothetical protein